MFVSWASQANTAPATFWTIAFLLLPENAAHMQQCLSELSQEEEEEGASVAASEGGRGRREGRRERGRGGSGEDGQALLRDSSV